MDVKQIAQSTPSTKPALDIIVLGLSQLTKLVSVSFRTAYCVPPAFYLHKPPYFFSSLHSLHTAILEMPALKSLTLGTLPKPGKTPRCPALQHVTQLTIGSMYGWGPPRLVPFGQTAFLEVFDYHKQRRLS